MPDLEIFSRDKTIVWRVTLQNKPMRLGRMQGLVDITTPPQDNYISKIHATVHWNDGKLKVTKHPDASNPVYRVEPGKTPTPVDEMELVPGDSFQIGSTVFRLCPEADEVPPTADEPMHTITTEKAYSKDNIREFRFADANQRVEALADLPNLILSMQQERMLEQQVLDTLLKGIPEADFVAIVRLDLESPEDNPRVFRLATKAREQAGRTGEEHTPSRRLVSAAIRNYTPTHHVWQAGNIDPTFTTDVSMDWALCAPMPDQIAPDIGIYAAGKLRWGAAGGESGKERQFQGDLKFAQLTADIYAAIRRMLELQQLQKTLSRFLPMPIVAQMLRQVGDFDEFLQARECEITVLFCDLRGSCRLAESGNDLKQLLSRLSEALSNMTDNIVSRWGVIGDFQGDAAMAFWGWPKGDRQIEQAAQAALHIQRRFREAATRSGIACGIGMAHGLGLAGRLGTMDQYKIGAFGPVVNLAARLEGLTKYFQVPILVDGSFAAKLPTDQDWSRKRRVARVRPAGMDTNVDLYELMPSEAEPGAMPEHMRRKYERALDLFNEGKWTEASNILGTLQNDGPALALKKFMAEKGGNPPAGWDGTIIMQSK
jgi:adenylate cyclase